MIRLALVALALLVTGGCASNSIEKHPAYPQIQDEVREIIHAVRRDSGAALLSDLRRLVAYDVFAVDQVATLAEEPNPRLRSNAVWVLAQIRDPGHRRQERIIDSTLRAALEDVEPLVRLEAAAGLAARGDWEVLPFLIDGLEDADAGVRVRCHEQLVQTTSQDFGFFADQPEDQRQESVRRWRQWFDAQSRARG